MMDKKIFILNGQNINSIEEFHTEAQNVLCPDFKGYGRNWAAFNDILRGGFGPFELDEKVIIKLKYKRNVRKRLGEGFLAKIKKMVEEHEHEFMFVISES